MERESYFSSQRQVLLVFAIAFGSLLLASNAVARELLNLIPSSRWIVLRAPLSPRSYDECSELAQEFREATRRLSEQHLECLDGTPADEGGSGDSCSKVSCQLLHTTREKASRKADEEVRTCRQRVSDFLTKQREDLRQTQQVAGNAVRAARAIAKDEAREKSGLAAEQQTMTQSRQDKDVRNERDRMEREARDERIRQEQEVKARLERESKATAQRKRTTEKAKAEQLRKQVLDEVVGAWRRGETATAQRESSPLERQQILNESIAQWVADGAIARNFGGDVPFATLADDAIGILGPSRADFHLQAESIEAYRIRAGHGILGPPEEAEELARERVGSHESCRDCSGGRKDPFSFGGHVKERALEWFGDQIGGQVVARALDLAMPIGVERSDPRYNAIAAITDEVRSHVLGRNPFAHAAAGLSVDGTHKVHRQVLGQLDAVGQQIDSFGKTDTGKASSSVTAPSPGNIETAAGTVVAVGPLAGERKVAPGGRTGVAVNVNTDARGPMRFVDSTTGRTFEVPMGQTLYRHPDSGILLVLEDWRVTQHGDEDRVVNGAAVCSTHGRGRILPECERRRANPFTAGTRPRAQP